ncbi:MAG: hypothetical protein EOM23_07760, partial [Candidatus Moranbacteria bacterium]|nr:hypothetical protein [Candidatus Moranbacteria bacterium]
AYYLCRKNKRNTINALLFEKHFEANLFLLEEEIKDGTYTPGRSIAFIVNKPVKREIFAADFRDRVVHHWLIGKLNPLFERFFIGDSYACRTGKGTHFGIKQVNDFIKICSENYKTDCYVLKLDIAGFFMHINRQILFEKLRQFILKYYQTEDKRLVLEICEKLVFNNPAENCIIKGKRSDWMGLPAKKSLFHSPPDCGLPIGNLTSQVFANFYLNPFDHFIKNTLNIRHYGRYVDDFVIVHQNKDYLKFLIPKIRDYLHVELHLQLHPNKIYLQHFTKGVKFLGVIIKPHRIYIALRTKGNFYQAIKKQNKIARDHKPTKDEQAAFLCSMNSYLGILKHYNTYNLRKRMIRKHLSCWWENIFYAKGYTRFVARRRIKKKSKQRRRKKMHIQIMP